MAYSDTQRAQFTPTNLGGQINFNGIQQLANNALSTYARFSELGAANKREKEAQEGKQQAFGDIEKGNTNLVKHIENARDIAYNNTVMRVQTQDLETKSQNMFGTLFADHGSDPKKFLQLANTYKKTILDDPSLSPEVKVTASQSMDMRIGALYNRSEQANVTATKAAAALKDQSYAIDSLNQSYQYLQKGDTANALLQYDNGLKTVMGSNSYADPLQKEKVIENYKKQGVSLFVNQMSLKAGQGEDGEYDYKASLKWQKAFMSGNLPKDQGQIVSTLLKGSGVTRKQLAGVMRQSAYQQYQQYQTSLQYDTVHQTEVNNNAYDDAMNKIMSGDITTSEATQLAHKQGADANTIMKLVTNAPKLGAALQPNTVTSAQLDSAVLHHSLTPEMLVESSHAMSKEDYRYYLGQLKSQQNTKINNIKSIVRTRLGVDKLNADEATQDAASVVLQRVANKVESLQEQGKPLVTDDIVDYSLNNVDAILDFSKSSTELSKTIDFTPKIRDIIHAKNSSDATVSYRNENPKTKIDRMKKEMQSPDFLKLSPQLRNKAKSAVQQYEEAYEEYKKEMKNGG